MRIAVSLLCFLSLAVAVCGAAEVSAVSKVDFVKEIQPLLTQHCLRCHGPAKRDGDLRLDSRVAAMKGGDSGQNALRLPIEKNELIRRLRSTAPGDRMPLEGDPLDESTIQKFETWLKQGADWPEPPENKFVPYRETWYERWATKLLRLWSEWHGRTILPALYFMLPLMAFVLILERAHETRRTQLKKGLPVSPWADRVSRMSRAWELVGLLVVALAAGTLWTRGRMAELKTVSAEVGQLRSERSMTDPFPDRPVRPRHAPWMGGTYYRGNDERSPALFNGGYYRTASLDLRLKDPAGRVLIWGDVLPQKATIAVEIEKATFAAPSLFTAEMMGAVGMSAAAPKELESLENPPHAFLKPGPREGVWVVELPLELDLTKPRQEGMVYLYAGMSVADKHLKGSCNFNIGYKLVVENGKLTSESELWMEAVVKPSNLVWTPDDRISAQEWFDILPIPEIINGNSSDPKLLGVEEHLEKLRKQRETNGSKVEGSRSNDEDQRPPVPPASSPSDLPP